MKKLLGILVLGLMLVSSPANSGSIGKGELTLSPGATDWFIKYIKGGWGKTPDKFVVTYDGTGTYWWTCPEANCTPGGDAGDVKVCEDASGQECGVFARGRTIKWKNGINKGKKESKINSKWSDAEIRAKLTELGFLGEATSSTESKDNTVEQSEDLDKELSLKFSMYNRDGVLHIFYITFLDSNVCDYTGFWFSSTKCSWEKKGDFLFFQLDSKHPDFDGSYSVNLKDDKYTVKSKNRIITAEIQK